MKVTVFIISIVISLLLSVILNFTTLKIIGMVDHESLGLKKKSNSIFNIVRYILKNKDILRRVCIISAIFLILNTVILYRIFINFSVVLFYIYLKYYYVFLILYIFGFIDYITYYVYTILSYPLISLSLFMFILSFFDPQNIRGNIETIVFIGLLYILINKFKFLGEGDFDVFLIVALTLGVIPTVFIFYLSLVMCGVIGVGIFIKNYFKVKNNRLAFVPFIFLATTIFITLKV